MTGDLNFLSGNGISVYYQYGDPSDPEYDVILIKNGVVSVGNGGDITIGGNSVATQYWVQQQGYALAASLSNYLPLTGGTLTGIIYRNSGGDAIKGRDNAIIRTIDTTPNSWHPAVAVKTSTGCWTLGCLGGESLLLSYDTDSNYQNNVNEVKYIYFPLAGSEGTLALTKDITSALSGYLPLSGGTITASGNDVQMLVTPNGFSWKVSGTTYGSITFSMSSQTGPQVKLGTELIATQTWVENQGYVTSSGSCNYAATAGSATYVTCPYSGYPNDVITDSTTSESLSKANNGTLFPVFHITDWGYSDTLYWSGYSKWGGTELATQYDSASAVRVKIRKYNQSLNGWGAWTEIITDGNIASYLGSNLVTSVCGYNGAVSKAELEQGLGLSSYVKPTVVDALADGVLIVYDSGGWVTTSGSTYLSGYLPLSAGNTKALTGTLYTRDINVASGYGLTITSGGIGIGTACGTGYVLDADGSIRATGIYVGSYAVRTTNDTYISGNTIYVGSNSLTVSSGGSGTVTSVATGTGLTGGTITTSGTISISSTYRTYISNGNTAYGWGNHANAGYLTSNLGGGVTISSAAFYSGQANSLAIGTTYSTLYIGSVNSSFVHFYNTAGVPNYFYTSIYAASFESTSDIRKKYVVSYDVGLNMESVANAPTIRFTWNENSTNKDKTTIHVGSIAQYWQTILPESVHEGPDGYLSMQYDVIALLSAISVAKRVTEHERRIETLERENAMLRLELNQIKNAA